MLKSLQELSYRHMLAEQDIKPFLVFTSFLVTFFVSRAIVYFFPTLNLVIFEYHIHHFYYGIILLAISNYIALETHQENVRSICAIMLGVGLGMIADEIGILLTCGTLGRSCDPLAIYWSRLSFDVVIYIVLLFLMLIFLPPAWKRLKVKKG